MPRNLLPPGETHPHSNVGTQPVLHPWQCPSPTPPPPAALSSRHPVGTSGGGLLQAVVGRAGGDEEQRSRRDASAHACWSLVGRNQDGRDRPGVLQGWHLRGRGTHWALQGLGNPLCTEAMFGA